MTAANPQAAFAAHVTTLAASLDDIDYYRLLGVARESSADDIKRAYHKAAGIYHPDAHRLANEQVRSCLNMIFKRMSEAYRVLNDHSRRRQYDGQLAKGGTQRLVDTKREKGGPKSPDAELKTPAGKRCFMEALKFMKQKNYVQAKLQLQLALNYEGQGCQAVKDKIAELEQLKAGG
jgi:DnaJ-class molecular chaperone